ncbi:7-cyano-7-deazaguanine synthase QueC [uncultured Megasphaera sp.]|uniref:7-cyano-7-deazaguanine synthase QueC n=1 Tax=uncultured Megasphaera sp. TaxID=165188 RepID=UPI0025FC79C1|nr:7-cyano-7-deazaguanine synthase QueC [uncultured Megasphaera sp.]
MKCVVLLSGGVDSTTCLAIAVEKYKKENVLALTAYYGQRHEKELQAARNVAAYYGVQQEEINLAQAFLHSDCPLLERNNDKEIAHMSYAEQLAQAGGEGTVETYVPFRNGLFLSFAAAVAVSVHAEVIYYGAHADDAAGRAYPDCTPEFEQAMNTAIYEGSGHTCHLEAPLLSWNKAGVVKEGLRLGAPYELTWSCYEGGDRPCGVCGTCRDRAAAFAANGVPDPALKQ